MVGNQINITHTVLIVHIYLSMNPECSLWHSNYLIQKYCKTIFQIIYGSENVLESFWLQPFNVKTNDVDGEKPRLAVLPKPSDILQVHLVALSPVSSCLTCSPEHVELAQTQTATELLHVFGTFWGISVKRFTILKSVSLLYASTVPCPSPGAVMFGFPGSVLTAVSKGTLANGINQLLFLKASFC